jgi:hypothetical protein
LISRRELLPLGLLLARQAQTAVRSQPVFLNYDRVLPVNESCRLAFPAELASLNGDARRRDWPRWIQAEDARIRARLVRGEEDSLVNFVLFGVSFTGEPRGEKVDARIRDFVQAIGKPGKNERLLRLKGLLGNRPEMEAWLQASISRYLAEQQRYRTVLERAPANDPAVAQLYKDRGLSVDTNFRPNLAIEQTLAELKRQGALSSVRRVAIIGPGLDFTDKDHGFDYYPLQTLQPFGLADSLLRLGLARTTELRISVFDISNQTLDHVSRAVERARRAQPYTVQLAIDNDRVWRPETLAYWRRFGDRIGTPVEAVPAPRQVRNVESRAVQIRPGIVGLLEPLSWNFVTQELPGNDKYDLVIATNVLVYYNAFERTLAALNIETMLSEGGIFLSNSPLPECLPGRIHSAGNVNVRYSAQADDDDRIEIYSNARFSRPPGPQ